MSVNILNYPGVASGRHSTWSKLIWIYCFFYFFINIAKASLSNKQQKITWPLQTILKLKTVWFVLDLERKRYNRFVILLNIHEIYMRFLVDMQLTQKPSRSNRCNKRWISFTRDHKKIKEEPTSRDHITSNFVIICLKVSFVVFGVTLTLSPMDLTAWLADIHVCWYY